MFKVIKLERQNYNVSPGQPHIKAHIYFILPCWFSCSLFSSRKEWESTFLLYLQSQEMDQKELRKGKKNVDLLNECAFYFLSFYHVSHSVFVDSKIGSKPSGSETTKFYSSYSHLRKKHTIRWGHCFSWNEC